ncbi:hypothetical protein [Pseudomonas putida]|uniref:hypothetical protein n=1 Tax=Pseudomonas putida TaxID=303 RepID=UPI0018D7C9B8|nr:hypothetical protein [Pseudomonas putida]MBH3413792.1 hypothetical protein [Pseudomonas putida]
MNKRTFIGTAEAGEPLITPAIEAMKGYKGLRTEMHPPRRWSVFAYRLSHCLRLVVSNGPSVAVALFPGHERRQQFAHIRKHA